MANYYVAIKTDGNGLHNWTPPTYLQTYSGDEYVPLGNGYYDYTWVTGDSEYAVYEVDTDIDFTSGSTYGLFAHTNPSVVNGGPTSINPGECAWDYAGENYWTPTFGEDEGDPYVPIYVFSDSYMARPTNTWQTISGGKDIYAKSNNLAIKFSINVTANTTYTFSLYTYSENNYDGIMISTNGSLSYDNIYLNSSASSTSGYINHCTGLGTTKTATYTPTSSGTIYVYFRTDSSSISNYNSTGCSYGRITWVTGSTTTITLNANGGSGGTGSVTGGYGSALPSITVPTRSGLEFLGYYDTSAISGGTQYYNSSGIPVRDWDKTGSTYTLYARWWNRVTWSDNTTYHYCTLSAQVATTTTSKRESILAMNPSCGTGTLSATLVSIYNYDTGASLPSSQWTLSPDGKKLSVPAGVSAANYEINITYTSPDGSNYKGEIETASALVNVTATYVTNYGNVYDYYFGEDASGEGIDPGDLGDGVVQSAYLMQIHNLPASAFTMSTSTVTNYFESSADYRQWVTYNNGASRQGTIAYDWSGNSTSFSSLGTTEYAEEFAVSFNTLTFTAIGEGGKSTVIDQINGAMRSANVVTWNAAPEVSYSISSYTFPAAGGTYDVLKSNVNAPAQTGTWTSGSSASFTPGNSDINLARTQTATGMTATSSGVTNGIRTSATNNTSTSTRGTMVIRARVTYKNETTKDAFINFTQAAGSVVYGNPVVTAYYYDDFPASALSNVTPYVVYEQESTWNGVSGSGDSDEYTYGPDDPMTSGHSMTFSSSSSTLSTGFTKGTNFATTGKVSVATRGKTTGAARSTHSLLSVVVTVNGKSSSSKACTACTQVANYLVWGAPPTATHTTPVPLSNAGQTYTMSPTATQTGTYTSGSTDTYTCTFTYAVKTAKTGYSLGTGTDANKVIVTNNTSTTARNGFVVSITSKGKTGTNSTYISGLNQSASTTKDVTFNQPAGAKVYETPVIEGWAYSGIALASGETRTPDSFSYYQNWTWNGVAGSGGIYTYDNDGAFATHSYSSTGTLPTGCTKASNFSTTGTVVWADRGTTVGDKRDASSNLKLTITANGKTSSAVTCANCKQEANGESADVFIFKYSGNSTEELFSGVAGVQKTDLPASALTLSTSNAGTYFGLPAGELFQKVIYTSGHYSLESLGSGSAVWSSPGEWTGSNTSLSSLGTTAKSRSSVNINTLTLTFTSRFNHSESKTFTSGMREANVQGTTKYKDTSGTEGTNITYTVPSCTINSDALTAAGGTFYVNCYVTNNTSWYYRYTSGSYKAASGTASGNARWRITSQTFTPEGSSTATAITRFSNPTNGGGSYSSMTLYPTSSIYKGSHSSMTTNAGTDTVTVTAYNLGDTSKTKTATATVTNSLGADPYKDTSGTTGYKSQTYGTPTSVTIGSGISASGGSATLSCTCKDTFQYYLRYTSGSYTSLQTDIRVSTIDWSINSQTFTPSGGSASTTTRFSISDSTLTHSNMTSNVGTDKVIVKATNVNATSNYAYSSELSVTNELGTQPYRLPYNGLTGYKSQTFGTPTSVTIGSGLLASGGSATASCTCNDTFEYYLRYTSGTYTSLQTDTHASTITWSINSQTFTPDGGSASTTTRFSISGSTVSHSSMGTNVGTDTVTVKATNANATSNTGTGSKSVTNAVESISLTVGNNPISFGSSTNATVIATYTSTATQDVTDSLVVNASSGNRIVVDDTTIISIT